MFQLACDRTVDPGSSVRIRTPLQTTPFLSKLCDDDPRRTGQAMRRAQLSRGPRMRKIHTTRCNKQVPGHQSEVDVKFLAFEGKKRRTDRHRLRSQCLEIVSEFWFQITAPTR